MRGSCLLYLRKSNGRKSVPHQRRVTTAHVEELGGEIKAEFTDADRTAHRKVGGAQPVRDGFSAMLETLRRSPAPLTVVAWHADRLTRNTEDTEELIRVCAAGRHLVITTSGGTYDLSTANGVKRLRNDSADAAYEVDHMVERMLPRRAEVALDGRWLGGKRPWGWERDPNPVRDGEPLVDEDGKPVNGMLRSRPRELEAIRWGITSILNGGTGAGVAREWNSRGLLTSGDKKHPPGQWTAREVVRVLKRPRNAGLVEHRGEILMIDGVCLKGTWEPAVTEEQWRSALAILDDPSRRTSPGPGRVHLLSWIARCGICDGPMICSPERGKNRKPRAVYRCRAGTRSHVTRSQAGMDDLITRLVIARLSRSDAADLLVKDRRDELAGLNREIGQIREKMSADRRLQRAGALTELEFMSGRREDQDALTACLQRIERLASADAVAPLIGDPGGVWETLALDRRRAVITALMHVRVLPAPKGRPPGWKPGTPYFDPEYIEITWRTELP